MKTSLATVSIGGTLDEKIDAIAEAGFDGLELFDDDLVRSGMRPEECALRCADRGLSIDLYQPFRRAEGITPEEFRAVLARFRGELETMQKLGTDAILVVSNTDADADTDRERSVSQLTTLATVAAEYGVTVMFEALAWGTHIHRVSHAWDVVERAAHPNLELVVDTFHLLASGDDASAVAALPRGAVGFLQLADAPWLSIDVVEWSRGHRCYPGEGEFELLLPTAAALAGGYQGTVSLEIFNPGYRERSPREMAQRGADSLRRFADLLDAGFNGPE